MVTARRTIRLLTAETAAIAINAAALGLWFYEDYSPDSTLLIYAIGAVSAVVFASITFLLAVPAKAADGSSQRPRKWRTLRVFALIAFSMLGVLWVFIAVFLFLMPHEPIDLDARRFFIALAIVLGFQLLECVIDAVALRPLSLKRGEAYLSKQGMGQAALLYFGVFIGVIVAAIFGNSWFAIPLFIFKLITDIGQPIQFFLGKTDDVDNDPNADLIANVTFKSRMRRRGLKA